jgi:hypothetical protein
MSAVDDRIAEIQESRRRLGIRDLSVKLDQSLTAAIQEGKRMSLVGKLAAISERARDFHADTERTLDEIAEKITTATAKRDEAAAKHHTYYDNVIAGVDETVSVIDRLSNVPLGEGSET